MTVNRIRLIISDLDGTLLSPESKLKQPVIDEINRFRAMGGLFTIATGRPLATTKPIADKLHIDLPLILCNGAVIAQEGQPVSRYDYSLYEAAPLLHEAHCRGLNVLMFCGSEVFTFKYTEDTHYYERKENISCRVLAISAINWKYRRVDKVILLGDIDVSRSLWGKYNAILGKRLTTIQSEHNYLEIIDRRCSKGNAAAKLAHMLQIHPNEIMTLGNECNDISMIRMAGIGVAVANGHEQLKAEADYISSKANGDGVIEAIKLFATESVASATVNQEKASESRELSKHSTNTHLSGQEIAKLA